MQTESTHETTEADPVFEEEQQHLTATYAKLQSMGRNLVAKMKKNSEDAAADKVAMYEELAPNFASYSDAMETYADFASVNRIIEAHNISQSVDAEKLRSIEVLLKQPYFAKVVLQFKPGEEPKELYIGTAGVADETYQRMVVDWRSPVAEVYYNQDNGPTSYRANDRTISVDLKLRRQFDIAADTLNSYFDTNVAIQDSLLLASLSKQRTAHMQAITATIQKEQNLVIRREDVPVLLVNGIAGSGKTSVLMQRIAYLFYQQRETLNPDEVFLITPNPVFQRYIDNVLPDLGERNPECLTWDEFLQDLLPRNRDIGQATTSLDSLKLIEQACEQVVFEEQDFKEIRLHGEKLLTVNQVRQVASKFRHIPAGPHLAALMREELLLRLETRLAQIAKSDEILDEISALSPDEQVATFRETFDSHDEDELQALAKRYVEERFRDAFSTVERDEWLRVDRIGMRLLNTENLTPIEWVYLKTMLTGLSNPSAKYVMIDEVQDYTAAQLTVLARYFSRAHFLLLGDENQAINPGTASFKEIETVFTELRSSVEECHLMTSYRSTSEITQLYASLLSKDEQMHISSIRRSDTSPLVLECATEEEYEHELQNVLAQAQKNDGLTAIVLPQKYQAKQLQKKPEFADIPLIDANDSLPEAGIVLVPLKLAKGLEFDNVIVADASENTFPADELSRRRLYTTISRATRTITLLSNGKLTPLLKN